MGVPALTQLRLPQRSLHSIIPRLAGQVGSKGRKTSTWAVLSRPGSAGKTQLGAGNTCPCTVEQRAKVLWIPLLSPCAGQVQTHSLSFHIPSVPSEHQHRWTLRVSSVCLELQALRNGGQGWVTEQDMNLPRG